MKGDSLSRLGRGADLTQSGETQIGRSPEEIRSHPGFPAARDRLVDAIAALYGNDVRMIRGLVRYERAVVFMLLLCLDASSRENPHDAATLGRLCDILEAMNVHGRRRIADIVSGLCRDGFIVSEPAPRDRRVRVLKPTPLMLEADRLWLAAFCSPLPLLYDAETYAPALELDRSFQTSFRIVSLREIDVAARPIAENPAIDFFIRRDVGIRVLMVMMQSIRGQEGQRTQPGFYSAAARRCYVSRNHVRNLLEEAARMGLVALSPVRGDYVEVLPALKQAVDRWVAESLAAIDRTTRLALIHRAGAGNMRRCDPPAPDAHETKAPIARPASRR